MEKTQIIRLPKKYWELFSTLSDEEAGKLIKEIFWYERWIEWMTRIYRDIIIVDVDNMESSAINGGKWWRPKSKPPVITPGYWKSKPPVIENDNLKEEKIRINKNKEEEEIIINNYISNNNLWDSRNKFFLFLNMLNNKWDILQEINIELLNSINDKIIEFKKKIWQDKTILEIEKFIEYHSIKKTKFDSVIARLNTWLGNLIK